MRGALNAKAECMAIAMEGPESMELKRKGLKVILDATLAALRDEGKVRLT